MASNPVIGVPLQSGKPLPLRLEANTWETPHPESSIQVSLFVRALQKFYAKDKNYKSDMLSYFRIAGIHGMPPNFAWSGAPGPSNGYYCTHGRITFPTWHRPYMALFEQTVQQLMVQCINDPTVLKFSSTSHSDKQDWIDAANSWRLPYWDWALPGAQLPKIFTTQTIQIRKPVNDDGTLPNPDTVINPCYQYQLPKNPNGSLPTFSQFGMPSTSARNSIDAWDQYTGTSRWCPASRPNFNGVNNFNSLNTEIAKSHTFDFTAGKSYYTSDLVARMLTTGYTQTFKDFSSTATPHPQTASPAWQAWLSLEQIHNNMHVYIGGTGSSYGHMSDPSVAAFDPIFFLHHCNIDRQFAMWQILYPKSQYPNAWIHTTDSPPSSAPLQPFYQANGQPYTSDSPAIYDWTKFNYGYDTLERRVTSSGSLETADQRRTRVIQQIRDTYPSTATAADFAPNSIIKPPGTVVQTALFAEKDVVPTASSQAGIAAAAAPEKFQQHELAAKIPNVQAASQSDAAASREIPSPSAAPSAAPSAPPSAPPPAPAPEPTATTDSSGPAGPDTDVLEHPDYLVNVLYDRLALQGNQYTINFLLNDRVVGSVNTFSAPILEHCENCAKQAKQGDLQTASVPLTIPLIHDAMDHGNQEINDIQVPRVGEYLRRHLSWQAVSPSGEIISMDRLPRTRIFVLGGRARHYRRHHGRSSAYDDYRPMPRVTQGKPCGASDDHYGDPAAGLPTV